MAFNLMHLPGVRNLGAAVSRFSPSYQPPHSQIGSVTGRAWPNPGQPVAPIAPKGSSPLAFPFWEGQNLIYTPRSDEEYTASALKTLATFPLADVCINNVKDQVCQMPWRIQLRSKQGQTTRERQKQEQHDPVITALSRFFERPDGFHMWDEWSRPYIDAMLVYDAPAIEMQRARKTGRIARLRVVPGDNIACYVNDAGDIPESPDPAYAQLWNGGGGGQGGIPRVDLTTDQLYYRPRNIQPRNTVSSYLYGQSPVQQSAKWIEIGIARLQFIYAYYRSGSIPDMIHVAPATATPEKIKEAFSWWNSEYAGNLFKRRGYSVLQGFRTDDKAEQILFPKEILLSDPFDDLLIRYIAFAIGSSAQRLMKQMNRASAGQAQESSEEEGTGPIARSLQSRINYIIWYYLGLHDYEMKIQLNHENDLLKAAQANKMNVDAGIQTRNAVLLANGDESDPNPLADELCVNTSQGAIPVGYIGTSQGAIPIGKLAPGSGEDSGGTGDPKKYTLIERGDVRKINGHA